jgi:hypothetical protein
VYLQDTNTALVKGLSAVRTRPAGILHCTNFRGNVDRHRRWGFAIADLGAFPLHANVQNSSLRLFTLTPTERAFTRATTLHCLGAHALQAVMHQNIPLLFLASKLNREPEVIIF